MKLWQQTAFATLRTPFLDKESQPARQGWPFRAQAFAFVLTVACVTNITFPNVARASLARAAGKVDRDVSAWKRQ